MRRLLLVLALVFIGLIYGSCSFLGSEDRERTRHELRPLAEGNWWEYEVTYSSIKDTLRYEVRKVETVSLEGETYTAFGWNLVPFPDNVPEYYWLQRNGQDGLYLMGGIAETDTLLINELNYKYPAQVGETWQVPQLAFSRSRFEFYVSDTLQITLVDNAREVETPAGTFRCYVYKFQIPMGYDIPGRYFDYYLFYSPGIGLIKQEERGDSDQRLITEMVLITYKI